MTPSTSYWNSPFVIASCLGATVFVFGSIFIFGVFFGQKNHARQWKRETAIVVQTVRLCKMSYRSPVNFFTRRKGSSREYLTTIDCKEKNAYLDANRDRYKDLDASEFDYIDISYPAIGTNTKRVLLSLLSEKPLTAGDAVSMRVHPKNPSLIEKISTDADFWKHMTLLTILSLGVFFGLWIWIGLERMRAQERRVTRA